MWDSTINVTTLRIMLMWRCIILAAGPVYICPHMDLINSKRVTNASERI